MGKTLSEPSCRVQREAVVWNTVQHKALEHHYGINIISCLRMTLSKASLLYRYFCSQISPAKPRQKQPKNRPEPSETSKKHVLTHGTAKTHQTANKKTHIKRCRPTQPTKKQQKTTPKKSKATTQTMFLFLWWGFIVLICFWYVHSFVWASVWLFLTLLFVVRRYVVCVFLIMRSLS